MKTRFQPEHIVSGMPGIVILSHGPMAVSMIDSAALILGSVENIAAFALEEGDDSSAFGDAFTNAIRAFDAGALVLIDLFGGTPCNQLLYHCRQEHLNIEALTGVNMPMLLDAVTSRSGQLSDWVQKIWENAGDEIRNLQDLI